MNNNTQKKSNGSLPVIGFAIFIIILIAAGALDPAIGVALLGTLSVANGLPAQNCAYVQGNATASCASILNGVVTSISSTQILSNYGPFAGPAYIVDFVLNGAGQSLTGTQAFTSQQVASLFNSSSKVSQNGQISITAQLNSQELVYPYYYGGVTLQMLSIKDINFPFSWFSNGAGYLTSCSQTNQNASNNFYEVACSGTYSNTDFQNVLTGYNNECVADHGLTFLNSTAVAQIFGGTVGQVFVVQCLNVTGAAADQVFYASSPNVASNASVTFSNDTLSQTLYLSNIKPQASYGSVLSAQIYGYTTGALNTYLGTIAPIMLVSPDGSSKFSPYETVGGVESLNQISGACFSGGAASIAGVPQSYIYSPSTLQNCITQQNSNINQIESQNLQPTDAFAQMQPLGATGVRINYKGTYTGAPWYGVMSVINDPVFYPQIQMIASQKTVGSLSVQVPVAYPYIRSYSPNPIAIQSGSTNVENFVVGNNASVAASAYLVVTAGNGTTVAQSPNFNIPAGGATPVSLNLGAYNPDLANLATSFTATVYSSQQTSIHSSITLGVNVKPNCPTGSVYVNNSNCVAEGHSCNSGMAWNGTGCQSLCGAPAVWNQTSHTCYYTPPPACPPGQVCGLPWWLWAIFAFLIIILIFLGVMTYRARMRPAAVPRRRR